jgi:uroporphyrinogen-III synthase
MGFDGLRVLALESRRATEMAVLVEKNGGVATVAPSMREVPIADNPEAFAFFEQLQAGEFDLVILLTGVGARALDRVIATRWPEGALAAELRKRPVVARGPKPMAVLREWNVPAAAMAPEPNTWRELMQVMRGRTERRIAVQEYGKSNLALLAALRETGAEVTPVPVYQWALPEDTAPLRAAARGIAAGEFAVVLLTTSIQVTHLLQVAAEEGVDVLPALRRMVIGSIGPTTSEALEEIGLKADMEPSHPKMGILVKEAGEQAAAILEAKR